jgi:hypothetical protein
MGKMAKPFIYETWNWYLAALFSQLIMFWCGIALNTLCYNRLYTCGLSVECRNFRSYAKRKPTNQSKTRLAQMITPPKNPIKPQITFTKIDLGSHLPIWMNFLLYNCNFSQHSILLQHAHNYDPARSTYDPTRSYAAGYILIDHLRGLGKQCASHWRRQCTPAHTLDDFPHRIRTRYKEMQATFI